MHLLYSTESPQAGNLHFYHLPKGWIHLKLIRQKIGQKEKFHIELEPTIMADPAKVYYLQYKPTFSSQDKININFHPNGFLKSISTEKEYPTWEELINDRLFKQKGKVKGNIPRQRQQQLLQEELLYETTFDPFSSTEIEEINKRLGVYGEDIFISMDDFGQLPTFTQSPGASQSLKPGIFCRPLVPFRMLTQTPGGTEKRLLYLPHQGRTHFIEVPAHKMVHSKLALAFDELGYPLEINIDKGSLALAMVQTPLRILRSIVSIITEVFQIRVNWKTLATKAVESDVRYQEALAKAEKWEIKAEQEAIKANQALVEKRETEKVLSATERAVTELNDENKFIKERSFPDTEDLKSYDMQLQVIRYSSGDESTLGMLFDVTNEKKFLAYTLEDEHRDDKVLGETRIPAGTYEIKFRKTGGFHDRYSKNSNYKDIHKGMLHVTGVPNFTFILIHVGNTDDNTAGCLLVADGAHQNLTQAGRIQSSILAYRRIYPDIAQALEDGKRVGIQYINYDMHE
ncbi:MAG: DUF5675 family protein [Bacteroidota bacterium]